MKTLPGFTGYEGPRIGSEFKWRNAMADTPKLTPKWAGRFDTFDDWVNRARNTLGPGCGPESKVRGYYPDAVCIDTKGRRCSIGGDFMRARDEGAFPVYFFWECEP